MESYAMEPQTLNKANLLSFREQLPEAEQLLGPLSFALRELYAVRCQHHNLERPNYKAGLSYGATLAEFDVAKAIHINLRGKVSSYPRSSNPDPRTFAYGHDIGELLLAAFANALQNRAGLQGLDAVEGALRSAMQATGSFKEAPLFIALEQWAKG